MTVRFKLNAQRLAAARRVRSTRRVCPPRERGVVLIVAMIVLLASAIMAISAMQNLGLNERMAGNFKDRQIAFQAAEATLRDAESVVLNDTDGPFSPLRPLEFSADCTNGLCISSTTGTPTFLGFSDSDWETSSTKTWAYGSQSSASNVFTDLAVTPRYAVAYLGTVEPIETGKPCSALFSVAARASGSNSATLVTLESIFRRRVGECYAAI